MPVERIGEKCGIFGVKSPGSNAASITYFGLMALQHRGHESSGIASTDGEEIYSHHGKGSVILAYGEEDIVNLRGDTAIGHNRYSTYLSSTLLYAQPVIPSDRLVAVGHNGNLPSVAPLIAFLTDKGLPTSHNNDTQMMTSALSYYLRRGATLEESIKEAYPLYTGAFSLIVMTHDKLAAVRDDKGIRPLSLGKLNGGYVFASESCAINAVRGQTIRDVNPGEMVTVDDSGLHSYQISSGEQQLDIFEFVYFARPDSVMMGKSVYQVRKNFGYVLAEEHPVEADIIVPIPESGRPAAIGYSQKSGIPFEEAITKNRAIGRTFIQPDQRLRDRDVEIKLNPIMDEIKGKRVAVVDDSIVRNTTMPVIVKILRRAGAREVHVLITSPPVKYPDFYGIDTKKQSELAAATKSVTEIREAIGADSLSYLSYEGMIKATGLPESVFSTSCFTGVYPVNIRERAAEVRHIN